METHLKRKKNVFQLKPNKDLRKAENRKGERETNPKNKTKKYGRLISPLQRRALEEIVSPSPSQTSCVQLIVQDFHSCSKDGSKAGVCVCAQFEQALRHHSIIGGFPFTSSVPHCTAVERCQLLVGRSHAGRPPPHVCASTQEREEKTNPTVEEKEILTNRKNKKGEREVYYIYIHILGFRTEMVRRVRGWRRNCPRNPPSVPRFSCDGCFVYTRTCYIYGFTLLFYTLWFPHGNAIRPTFIQLFILGEPYMLCISSLFFFFFLNLSILNAFLLHTEYRV